jgi:FkbM family methyltransferase
MLAHVGDELRLIARGARPRDTARLLRLAAYYHLRIGRARAATRWVPARRRAPQWDVQLRDGISLRLRPGDAGALFAVLGLGEYRVDLASLAPVRSVLDLGANIGLAAIVLACAVEEPHIVCVEPDEASFPLLVENLRRNLPAAVALHAAVGGRPGRVRVVAAHFPGANHTVPAAGGDGVEALTVAGLLDRAGMASVDLLKIDVEGAEREVFDDAPAWAGRVRAIIGEVHPPLTVRAVHERLRPLGFVPHPVPDGRVFEGILFVARPSPRSGSASRADADR